MKRMRVTASEKKQRHEWAMRQIDAGMGLSELTAFTAETWGYSRRGSEESEAEGPPLGLRSQAAPACRSWTLSS